MEYRSLNVREQRIADADQYFLPAMTSLLPSLTLRLLSQPSNFNPLFFTLTATIIDIIKMIILNVTPFLLINHMS